MLIVVNKVRRVTIAPNNRSKPDIVGVCSQQNEDAARCFFDLINILFWIAEIQIKSMRLSGDALVLVVLYLECIDEDTW